MEDLRVLLKLARMSILEEFEGKKLIDKEEWIKKYPFLAEKRACFVTLKMKDKPRGSNLRGCIGSILPYRPLIDDVVANAKAAAFEDPRFPPLTPEEFERVKIEVSVLTIPEKLEYEDKEDLMRKIRPGVDGVILQLANHQATFLPSVWEELPAFELFFAHLCMKARLPGDCLMYHPTIYTYQAVEVEEEE
ncbi:AmmeMemoRadiSam system protein A [Nautilia sp. PV-1]|uniref:AmmeMemoRadiSam system protein A n=1 Tax=Nautilia sp. PV-1 TaxID=2579250 RepID=UPI000FD9F33C|nr:AmmeMemoRadiSam system protein A [Nautilia sp. PV-1]AZV47429.1 AmmeMemoRadiSam system protein A [Nautilia sp. PV-1]